MNFLAEDTKCINKILRMTLTFNIILFSLYFIYHFKYKHATNNHDVMPDLIYTNYTRHLENNYGKSHNKTSKHHTQEDMFMFNISKFTFKGRWKSDDEIPGFINQQGIFRLIIQHVTNYKKVRQPLFNYKIFIDDGENKARWMMLENEQSVKLNHSSIILSNSQTEVNNNNSIMLLHQMRLFNPVYKSLRIVDFNFKMNMHQIGSAIAYGKLEGNIAATENIPAFNLSFTADIEIPNLFLKISNFSICLCILGILQLFHSKNLVEIFETDIQESNKV